MGSLTARSIALALAIAVVACGSGGGGLDVDGVWARPTTAATTVGAVYLRVTSAEVDELLGATVDPAIAGSVQLHRTVIDEAGTATMTEQSGLGVPADGELVLEPLGDHLMLIDLADQLSTGETFDVTLRFAAAGDVTVEVEVRDQP